MNKNEITEKPAKTPKKSSEKTQPKVSIVVPIYGVERYLRECVDSILRQTLKEIEILLVDDGSPDKCPEIVDEYAKKDPRVVAIHQENGGYGKAVNRGIATATGEYIGIIESDDWIEPDMYEKLYASAKKYDTDITKGMFYFYNSTLPKARQNRIFTNVGDFDTPDVDLRNAPDGAFNIVDFPDIIAFHASIWSCIYRADFVKKIKLFDKRGTMYQDFPFMVDTMTRAKRISVVKRPFVHWRNDPKQGNSTSQHNKKLLAMTDMTDKAYEILLKSGLYDELKEAFFVQADWANYGFFLMIDPEYKREYFERLQKIFEPLRDDKTFKYEYFRVEDRRFVSILLTGNFAKFKRNILKTRARHLLKRVYNKISVTHRALDYIKGQNLSLERQNEQLRRELDDLATAVEKLGK